LAVPVQCVIIILREFVSELLGKDIVCCRTLDLLRSCACRLQFCSASANVPKVGIEQKHRAVREVLGQRLILAFQFV
jgi:hypothetical protein